MFELYVFKPSNIKQISSLLTQVSFPGIWLPIHFSVGDLSERQENEAFRCAPSVWFWPCSSSAFLGGFDTLKLSNLIPATLSVFYVMPWASHIDAPDHPCSIVTFHIPWFFFSWSLIIWPSNPLSVFYVAYDIEQTSRSPLVNIIVFMYCWIVAADIFQKIQGLSPMEISPKELTLVTVSNSTKPTS